MTQDNEKLLEAVYLEVLGRPVDESGKKTHLNAMKTHSIDEVKKVLRCSPEYRDAKEAIFSGKIGKDVAYIDGSDNIVWSTAPTIPVGAPPLTSASGQKQVMFVSSWNINCGIAIYTKDLVNAISEIKPDLCGVHPLIDKSTVTGDLVHLQNELGIMPEPPKVDRNSKVIITWHTIPINMSSVISVYESKLNVVAHIVASEDAAKPIRSCSNKDVYVINIGSTQIPPIDKQHAKQLLNITVSKPIGFIFGFRGANKKYHELINAAKNTGIHLIISGAKNDNDKSQGKVVATSGDITYLGRYLSELEVSLYALASDILLFNYLEQKHYSSSAAMHRIIGAGRPVICSDIKHFIELTNENALKFSSPEELEDCIRKAIGTDNAKLSKGALDYATLTSWPIVAKKHMDIYQKYIGFGK